MDHALVFGVGTDVEVVHETRPVVKQKEKKSSSQLIFKQRRISERIRKKKLNVMRDGPNATSTTPTYLE